MPWNGSGVFTRQYGTTGWQTDAAAGVKIVANRHDTNDGDLATGINNCLTKDGQNVPTANLPMGGFKHTGVAVAAALTDYARADQVQNSAFTYLTIGGTADVITATSSPAFSAYATGQMFHFVASGTNTTAVTLQINGIAGAKAVTKNGTVPLTAGDIKSGATYIVVYDGTRFQLSAPPITLIASGSASAVSDIQFLNLNSAYEAYSLILHDLLPATSATDLYIQVSSNNGSSWLAGASDYKHIRTGSSVSGSPGTAGSNADTKIVLANSLGNSGVVGNELRGFVYIHAPADANDQTAVTYQVSYTPSGGNYTHYVGGGARTSSGADNAVRLIMSSGNITTCTYALYGMRNT